jgi:hypothetical protein
LIKRANARAYFKTRIPALANKALKRRLDLGGLVEFGVRGHEYQDIDIGVREQLASAIAPDGKQRKVFGQPSVSPEFFNELVCGPTQLPEMTMNRPGAKREGMNTLKDL